MKYRKPEEGDTIAVWVSCGAASAVAALKTKELYGKTCNIRLLNNPIAEEHEDNTRFLNDLESYIGIEIEPVINSKWENCSCAEVWQKRKYMSNKDGQAPCTYELKKMARAEWEENNTADSYVFGFTYGEEHREERLRKTEVPELLPLLSEGKITKARCYAEIGATGIDLPEIYNMGYPNANCIGCVKATSPTYWNHVRKNHPDVFEWRAVQSREIGAKLVRVKGERLYLDQLGKNALGRPMKNMDFECGLFCEEIE